MTTIPEKKHFRIRLITTDPSFQSWRSKDKKLANVSKMFNLTPDATWEVVPEFRALKPDIKDGRITHAYMDRLSYAEYRLGYDFTGLHMSAQQRLAWGLEEGLRGANQVDKDFVGELYFWADENTKRNGLNQFEQTFPHELSHAIARGSKVADLTHAWHTKNPDISGIFATYRMELYEREARGIEKAIKSAQAEINLLAVRINKYPNTLWPAVARKANELERLCALEGLNIRITETVRSCARQNELYAQGRTSQPGKIVTNAQCGESLHQYGVAFDVVFRDTGYAGPWAKVGALGEKLGLEWGGRWKSFPDKPHFQLMLGHTLADFQKGKVNYKLFF